MAPPPGLHPGWSLGTVPGKRCRNVNGTTRNRPGTVGVGTTREPAVDQPSNQNNNLVFSGCAEVLTRCKHLGIYSSYGFVYYGVDSPAAGNSSGRAAIADAIA